MPAHDVGNETQQREPLAAVMPIPRLIQSAGFWWALCLPLGAALAWGARHSINPDGLSYLDMASEAAHGDVGALINGYWSPGYPALLAAVLWCVSPAPESEFAVVHLANFVVLVGALAAFHWWLRCWSPRVSSGSPAEPWDGYLTPLAWCVFIWLVLVEDGIGRTTPDRLVAVVVFLAAACVCRLSRPGAGLARYATLGAVLALGYYAKAAMLPLGLALIGILLVFPPTRRVERAKLLVSLLVLLLLCLPLAVMTSVHLGRPSFGESGRLNYAWYVNGLQFPIGWTGSETDAYGAPEHPPRTLLEQPRTLEFATPIAGTYPLWYEPSYWYAGVKPAFELRKQIAALGSTLQSYSKLLLRLKILLAGVIVLWGVIVLQKGRPGVDRRWWWQVAWPLAACLMYSLVFVTVRYVAVFFVLLFLAVYRGLATRVTRGAAGPVLATVACASALAALGAAQPTLLSAVRDVIHPRPSSDQRIASALHRAGVAPGSSIAVVGNAFDASYARIAGVRIVAQVMDAEGFSRSSPPELGALVERLASLGVKAIVARRRPAAGVPGRWRDLPAAPDEPLSVLVLDDELAASGGGTGPPDSRGGSE